MAPAIIERAWQTGELKSGGYSTILPVTDIYRWI